MDKWYIEPDYNGGGVTRLRSTLKPDIKKAEEHWDETHPLASKLTQQATNMRNAGYGSKAIGGRLQHRLKNYKAGNLDYSKQGQPVSPPTDAERQSLNKSITQRIERLSKAEDGEQYGFGLNRAAKKRTVELQSAKKAKKAQLGGKPYQSRAVIREGSLTQIPKESDMNKKAVYDASNKSDPTTEALKRRTPPASQGTAVAKLPGKQPWYNWDKDKHEGVNFNRRSELDKSLMKAVSTIDMVLGKLDKKTESAMDKPDSVDGDADTKTKSVDVWTMGTPSKQGCAIDGDKKKTK